MLFGTVTGNTGPCRLYFTVFRRSVVLKGWVTALRRSLPSHATATLLLVSLVPTVALADARASEHDGLPVNRLHPIPQAAQLVAQEIPRLAELLPHLQQAIANSPADPAFAEVIFGRLAFDGFSPHRVHQAEAGTDRWYVEHDTVSGAHVTAIEARTRPALPDRSRLIFDVSVETITQDSMGQLTTHPKIEFRQSKGVYGFGEFVVHEPRAVTRTGEADARRPYMERVLEDGVLFAFLAHDVRWGRVQRFSSRPRTSRHE